MHTQSTGYGGGGLRVINALLAALCLTLAAALLLPTTAGAGVHSFRAMKVKNGVATFAVKRARKLDIRSAKVVTPRGKVKRISVGRLRRAARKGVLRVRIARKHSRKRHARLRVRSRAGKSGKRNGDERRERPKQPSQPAAPAQPSQPTQPAEPISTPPKDPILVIDTNDSNTEAQGGSCAGGTAATFSDPSGFGYPNWPSACWRPFADGTPFNQRISAGARLVPNSAQIVANLNSLGPVTHGRAGIADTCDDYHKVIYWAKSSDPVWTIRGGSVVSPYDIDGAQLRMPETARPAGCTQAGGSDRHLAVVWNGYEYGMWNVRIDRATHTIYPATGRKLPVSGDGLNGSCTEARFTCLAGRIRYQELEAGHIDHALFASSNHIRTGYSFPAMQGSQDNPGLNGDWPQNGTRLQLDPSYATDAWLAQFPAWKRSILRALRDYGAYFGDDGGSNLTVTSFESGTGFTSFGLADPFTDYARSHVGQSIFESGGTYYFDVRSGVDWSKLRVVDPCVAQKTC
jgi:hypothetical protein